MNFGIIGAGEIGETRARAMTRVAGCRLVAVADPDQDRARLIAEPARARLSADWRSLVDDAGVDAVIVSTPPDSHEQIARAALEAGKHVICEKPLAPNPEACRAIVETARRNRRTLAVGFNQRYFPAVEFVKAAIERGDIGEPRRVRAYAGHRGLVEFRTPWESDPSIIGGGALMDNGMHLIDHVRHLLGDFDQVTGMTSIPAGARLRREDNGVALLQAEDGRTATIEASWSEWRGYRFHIDVYGDAGMARAYYGPMFALLVRNGAGGLKRTFRPYLRTAAREKLFGWKTTVEETFRREIEDFVRWVEDGKRGRIAEGFDGFRAVEIVHAVYRAAESGARVRLSPLF